MVKTAEDRKGCSRWPLNQGGGYIDIWTISLSRFVNYISAHRTLNSSIGWPMIHHGVENPLAITDKFWFLKKSINKFECLVYEVLFIQQLKPTLNVESHSICAKLSYSDIYIIMKHARMQSNLLKL